MAWPITALPRRFAEAVEWFGKRFPATREALEALGEYAGKRAWTIAGVGQLDVLLDVIKRVERAIETGLSLDAFKKDIRETLTKAWGRDDPHRIETIFRTNVQKAYNAGRYRQLTTPRLKKTRPLWEYDAIFDRRTSDICRPRDKTILRADHPWWQANYPPLHHQCRSTVRALTEREARRRGYPGHDQPPVGAEDPTPGFGSTPDVDQPWDGDLDRKVTQAKAEPVKSAYQQKKERRERDIEATLAATRKTDDADLFYLKDHRSFRAGSLRYNEEQYLKQPDRDPTEVALEQPPIRFRTAVVDGVTKDTELEDGRHRWHAARMYGARKIRVHVIMDRTVRGRSYQVDLGIQEIEIEDDGTRTIRDESGKMVDLTTFANKVYKKDREKLPNREQP